MAPERLAGDGDDVPTKQVNNILQNLRGEHFRHARNIQRKSVSRGSLSSYVHNQPTLPVNLIYPSPTPPTTNSSRVPGPSPPRSWRSLAARTSSLSSSPSQSNNDIDTPEWRAHALSPLFSATDSDSPHSRLIYPDPNPVPQLTLLCLQLILSACPGPDLAHVVPHIPRHLRRALLRYTAIHAPLSQVALDALRQGTAHVDTELIVVGPYNALRGRALRQRDDPNPDHDHDTHSDGGPAESWDAPDIGGGESLALRALAVLSSPLAAPTLLALPPTLTHLALVRIPQWIALHRLSAICPLLVFLDVSYNSTWLHAEMLEEVEWGKWRALAVLGLRGCAVTPKVLMELNRGRWEDVEVLQ